MAEISRSNSSCLVLLYAPTKPDIYIPLIEDIHRLEPIRREIRPWKLNSSNSLERGNQWSSDFSELQINAYAARNLISKFASENHIIFVDPSISMTQAVVEGKSPFMRYDTHWSATGHQLVANMVLETLKTASCSP
jgi:hypothetical protein